MKEEDLRKIMKKWNDIEQKGQVNYMTESNEHIENLDIEGLENCYRKQKFADAQEEKETRAMHYEALARITASKKVKEIKERLNGKT